MACQPDILDIHHLMIKLGIPSNYVGFLYASYAVYISVQDKSRLELVTKLLYPDVAKRYRTNWQIVEHNIRTLVKVCWEKSHDSFSILAGKPLHLKPSVSEFISYLAEYYVANYDQYNKNE